jgi:hypothetical protein
MMIALSICLTKWWLHYQTASHIKTWCWYTSPNAMKTASLGLLEVIVVRAYAGGRWRHSSPLVSPGSWGFFSLLFLARIVGPPPGFPQKEHFLCVRSTEKASRTKVQISTDYSKTEVENGPLDKWFLVSGYLRNYLVLHSITLLIDDQYDGHSIKLV